jgi:hypothetical protein
MNANALPFPANEKGVLSFAVIAHALAIKVLVCILL